MNTSISKPKDYMDYSMGLGSSPLIHGAILPTLCQMKYQHHSSAVNGTDSKRDINTGHKGICEGLVYILPKHRIGRGKTEFNVQVVCLHNINHLAERWTFIYRPALFIIVQENTWMKEKAFFCITIRDAVYMNHHLPRSTVWSHTTYRLFIYVQRIVVVAERKAR